MSNEASEQIQEEIKRQPDPMFRLKHPLNSVSISPTRFPIRVPIVEQILSLARFWERGAPSSGSHHMGRKGMAHKSLMKRRSMNKIAKESRKRNR